MDQGVDALSQLYSFPVWYEGQRTDYFVPI